MSKCKAGIFLDNMIVRHSALSCYGGFGDKPCIYLQECMTEHDIKPKRKPHKEIK